MKVIFLDFDGVLNVISQGHDQFGSIFHPHLIKNLKRIIDATGAVLVISSSWRGDGLQRMKDMWSFRSYPGIIVDITGRRHELDCFTRQRGHEIQDWLDKHLDVTSYVILDDDGDMLAEQYPRLVLCSGNTDHEDKVDWGYGLTSTCADQAIQILNQTSNL